MRLTFPLLLLCAMLLTVAPLFDNQTATAAITPGGASALAPQASEITKIEAYARQLDAATKSKRGRYFADVASENEQTPRWREFKTKREFDKSEAYTAATVWAKPTGEVLVASFSLSSPSGDWAMYNTYYFREDGTLAKLHSELRTFMGNLIVIRDRLYDPSGKMIQEKTRYQDLKTRKAKRVNQGDYQDMPIEIYLKATDLPFYKLMKNH